MKKASSKSSKRKSKKSVSRGAGKIANLDDLRQKLANRVAHEAPGMVDATIGEVMKGQHQPMKYLFEMIGLYPGGAAEEKPGADVLARTLLRRLEFPGESVAKAEEDSSSTAIPVTPEVDTVE